MNRKKILQKQTKNVGIHSIKIFIQTLCNTFYFLVTQWPLAFQDSSEITHHVMMFVSAFTLPRFLIFFCLHVNSSINRFSKPSIFPKKKNVIFAL
jgi:hypothetical protein